MNPNTIENQPLEMVDITAQDPNGKQKKIEPSLTGKELEARIEKLAKLPPLEYEFARQAVIKESGLRAGALDSITKSIQKKYASSTGIEFTRCTSWDAPVTTSDLLTEIDSAIRQFIICDPETSTTATLWVVMSWIIDKIQVAPLAVITAPEKGCGKSQLLGIMAKMVCKPLTASCISPAALYRVIESHQPTLMIDETDTFMKENEDLRGIINSGHTRDSAYVIKTVGDNHTPTRFSTWGAKALSGIGKLPDTIMDRAVILQMRKRLPHEKVMRLRHAEEGFFETITSKIQRCIEDFGTQIALCRPNIPESLSDRAQDNWEPLLAIADTAGGDWPVLARRAALKLSSTSEDSSVGNELLTDIHAIFENRGIDRIRSTELIHALTDDEEMTWATYNRGKPLRIRQLSKRLAEYGISSKTVRFGYDTHKGFEKAQFDDAFSRYLHIEQCLDDSVTQSHPNEGKYCAVTDVPESNFLPIASVTPETTDGRACDFVTVDPESIELEL